MGRTGFLLAAAWKLSRKIKAIAHLLPDCIAVWFVVKAKNSEKSEQEQTGPES